MKFINLTVNGVLDSNSQHHGGQAIVQRSTSVEEEM
jgi:hypothetical protein